MEPTHNSNNKKVGIGIAVVAILALIGITVAANKKSEALPVDTTSTATLPAATTTSSANTTTNGQGEAYKDGTYTATGSYMSPGGEDQIGVTLTLKDDKITAATVTQEPGDHTSAHYQSIFAANYQQYVIGQDIATLKLDKVSGSSLTGQGFNDAVVQIEAQAKA